MRFLRGVWLLSIALALPLSCSFDTVGTGEATATSGTTDADTSADVASVDGPDESDGAADVAIVDAPSTETTEAAPAIDASSDVALEASQDAAPDVFDAAFDTGAPGTVVAGAALGSLFDRVGSSDQALAADGTVDGTFSLAVIGPIDGLLMVTTNAAGVTTGNSQWDTVVLTDPQPNVGNGYTTGSQTWILGVYEGANRVNDAAGRISLGAGVHALTLFASNNGTQTSGQHYRVYARASGTPTWLPSPIITF